MKIPPPRGAPSMRVPRPAVVLVPILVAGAVVPAASAAVGGPDAGVYYLQSVGNGLNAALSGSAVVQHRPKGNEDHQQWSVRPDGDAYRVENLDAPGQCLGRSGTSAAAVACGAADAAWQVTASGPGRWRVKDPAGERYLTTPASGETLAVGGAADWYLTALTLPRTALPAPDSRTLDQVSFLTAHNAYANGVDGGFAPPILNLFPNQSRGISQQLADGVRGFMLDLHQTRDGAILCHQSCVLVSRPVALLVDLGRIVDFLRSRPGEFVTVFLEDYTAPDVLRNAVTGVPGLDAMLFRPDREGVRQDGWPRLSELRQRGKQLMIFTDHSRAQDQSAGLTRDSFGVMYQPDWTVENYWSMGGGTGNSDWSCYSRWGDIPLTRTESAFRPLFVMNHFRDTPVEATMRTDNSKVLDRAQRFCEPAARKKPTYLAVDRYDLGNPMSAVTQLNTYWYAGS
jgi:hypothetical protein